MSEKLTTSEMAAILEKIATDSNGAVASSLMKTLLSKNITIDDWNTFAKILADHSINDTVLQEFSKAVVKYLESLDSKDKSLANNIGTLQTDISANAGDITRLTERVYDTEGYISVLQTDVQILYDLKLDKVSTANIIYATDGYGHQTTLTIGEGLSIENGVLKATAEDGTEVVQDTGTSTTAVMSQKAVTDAINNAIMNTLNTKV